MANRILRGRTLPTGWSTTAILLAAIGAPGPAQAAIDLTASASIGLEHDSNPLELSNSEVPSLADNGSTARADTSARLTANVTAATGGKGPLQTRLQAMYSREKFQHRDTLDHSDYTFGGNLDWKPGQVFDISLAASQSRLPIGLADIGGEESTQQTTRVAEGTLHVRPTPRWQVGVTPSWQQLRLPLPETPDFELRESSGALSLDYLGAGRVIPGVVVKQARGTYSGIEDATRYEDKTVQGTLDYKVTDFSTFSLSAGHTQRSTRLIVPSNDPQALALEGTKPAFTGSLLYKRQLSVKTAINLGAYRDFQQYDAGVNTTVGTGFGGGITWATNARLAMAANTQFVWTTISGQLGGQFDDRRDLVRSFAFDVKYLATRHVSVRSYVSRRIRNSTIRSALFTGTTAGVELTATID